MMDPQEAYPIPAKQVFTQSVAKVLHTCAEDLAPGSRGNNECEAKYKIALSLFNKHMHSLEQYRQI